MSYEEENQETVYSNHNPRRNHKFFSNRSQKLQDYDADVRDLSTEKNGLRVWYEDYSSIDWIHDMVKNTARQRQLKSIKGIRGKLLNVWEHAQMWLLVGVVGALCGSLAAMISFAEGFFSDLKLGYCKKNVFHKQTFCCWDSPGQAGCADWVNWRDIDILHRSTTTRGWVAFIAYIGFAVLWGLIAGLLVYYGATMKKNPKGKPIRKLYAAGSGIPEVKTILSGFVIRGYLGFRTLWVKFIGIILSVSSGLATGKEGPLVHIACCLGNVCCRALAKVNKNEAKKREVLSAAAAAGVAVAFAAPVGGALFSLEEVSYYFPNRVLIRSFVCAFSGAFFLKLWDPFRTGKIVLFQVFYDQPWQYFELIFFFILGIFGGLFGYFFVQVNLWYNKMRSTKLKNYPILEVVVLIIITTLCSYWNKWTKISNSELVAELFQQCKRDGVDRPLCPSSPSGYGPIVGDLAIALVIKTFLVCFTFGIRIPCGIFIPSMVVGALAGKILGIGVELLHINHPSSPFFSSCGSEQCINPGLYAVVGAAATLTGTTRMTISLIVIMLELTGSLSYVLPLIIANLVAKWTGDVFSEESIYDGLIEQKGHPYLDSKKEYIFLGRTGEITEYHVDVISVNEPNTIKMLKKKIQRMLGSEYPDGGFPILDHGYLIGYIACNELEYVIKKLKNLDLHKCCHFTEHPELVPDDEYDFSAYMDHAPVTVTEYTPMEVVLELFIKLGTRYLCVVDKGRFVGVIHKKRLLGYLKEYDNLH
ncbi:hypothetical protein K493DRAFT_241238 [Basidiobolus meristosporus CBS 931.73]|uniref:Chloride channel protein n=1 Tax=Basidiobolus meristosporus CBS 931.73 TaxID=1314790 RepID=A0A1Y1X8K1_9FUNG|nr:hypothetical protein K493DRAFT_241238 [Basidiobolus meristosporus CBS 931.73]|eukprot:ORX82091.1 hypothetical protein K493DRAFT_241238 [Basidiobolus meristosporus CBS 931.73]